jgi:protein-disulfide isomerase-like protein with CxxC motif
MTMQASDLILRLSEKDFQQRIIDRARALGWLVYHTHDSRRSAAGFPDLVLARNGQMVFAEVKAEKGRVSDAQEEWLAALRHNPYHQVYVWRPSDLADIEKLLA